jgi:hypothetical protein
LPGDCGAKAVDRFKIPQSALIISAGVVLTTRLKFQPGQVDLFRELGISALMARISGRIVANEFNSCKQALVVQGTCGGLIC